MNLRRVGDCLHADLQAPHLVLSHAVLGGGFTTARHWLNQQVYPKDFHRRDPDRTLRGVAKTLGLSGGVVGMMTGAHVRTYRRATRTQGPYKISVVGTAGLKNGVLIGEDGTFDELAHRHTHPTPHTINLLVVMNQPLTKAALVEAHGVAVQARTLAVMHYSEGRFSGSGTDCVAVACPLATKDEALRFAGLHTVLGSLLGRTVQEATAKALQAWPGLETG